MRQTKKKLNKIIITCFCFFVALPVYGAELYFGTNETEIAVGSTFEVGVFVDTEGERVNAFEGSLTFPSDAFSLEDVRDADSIVNLWLDRPQLSNVNCQMSNVSCSIPFSGLVPGGYIGSEGALFSVVVKTKSPENLTAVMDVMHAKVFLHDGEGTETKTSVAPLSIKIWSQGTAQNFSAPEDHDPPEGFTPTVTHDPSIFDNQFFVTFLTQDKNSGMQGYDVFESTRHFSDAQLARKHLAWKSAQSPYQLLDQSLRSYVYVRATDRAGNTRIAVVNPGQQIPWYENFERWSKIVLIIVVLIFGSCATFVWRSTHTKKHRRVRGL